MNRPETETGSLILVFCVHICISNWWFNNIIIDCNGDHAPQRLALNSSSNRSLMTRTGEENEHSETIKNVDENCLPKIMISMNEYNFCARCEWHVGIDTSQSHVCCGSNDSWQNTVFEKIPCCKTKMPDCNWFGYENVNHQYVSSVIWN